MAMMSLFAQKGIGVNEVWEALTDPISYAQERLAREFEVFGSVLSTSLWNFFSSQQAAVLECSLTKLSTRLFKWTSWIYFTVRC